MLPKTKLSNKNEYNKYEQSIMKTFNLIYLLLSSINYEKLFIFHGVANITVARIKNKFTTIYEIIILEKEVVVGSLNELVEIVEIFELNGNYSKYDLI